MQMELPTYGIQLNLYIDMIYGKTEIKGCEKIVKRLVLFSNTYKVIGTR